MKMKVFFLILAALLLAPVQAAPLAPVVPGHPLRLPQDEGSHPSFGTEWWYVTGWLQDAAGRPYGFQVTFFRHRTTTSDANPSLFAPKQILFAHAALTDPRQGHLLHDQRIARAGFGLAEALPHSMNVWIKDWGLKRQGKGYHTQVAGQDFALQLDLTPTQPPLINGIQGYSQKGPAPGEASYYYSLPQLKASGTVTEKGHPVKVTGTAWFDHEWSSAYLPQQAVGWDWAGINLLDGGALMAFRMRDAAGKSIWAGGTYRNAQGQVQVLSPPAIRFMPLSNWTSSHTGIRYPVSMRLAAGPLTLLLSPLLADQENDARSTVGSIYWEGAVQAYARHTLVGRGYLELTGYGKRLQMQDLR